MSDKQSQRHVYTNLKQKHVGVGNQDTTEEEWLSNVKRDTYYSILSHSSLLEYTTLVRNQQPLNKNASNFSFTKKQMKWELLNKMGRSGW